MTPCIVCEVVLLAEPGQTCFTCKKREQERAKHRRHYAEISRMKCRHCHKNKRNTSRGLCSTCYRNPCISKYYNVKDTEEKNPLPARKQGEPPYRCVWCGKFRCKHLMSKCDECEAKCKRLLARLEEDVA